MTRAALAVHLMSPPFISARHWLNRDNAKADVVIPPLGFEPQPTGRPARPPLIRPAPASAHARRIAGSIVRSGGERIVQIGIDAARKLRVRPVPAPLVGVAVHVMQPPGVGGITADFGGSFERR